jgi:EAL domain-containing protein (putative c-di-GMP-specific phosphodiesterase class I)/GGDEF domain-containing protein
MPLLLSYKEEFNKVVNLDKTLGFHSNDGKMQRLEANGEALLKNLTEAAVPLKEIVQKNIDWSMVIIGGSMLFILLIGITFVLQNRAYLKTIYEKKQKEDELEFVSNYDAITGLPNLEKFLTLIDRKINLHTQEENYGLMVIVKIANYDMIQEAFGRESLTVINLNLTERLKNCKHAMILGHLDVSNFLVYIHDIESIEQGLTHLEAMSHEISLNYYIDDQEIYVNFDFGIAIYPDDNIFAKELVANAQTAISNTTREVGSDFNFYSETMSLSARKRLTLISNMKKALENKEFFMVYQPIISFEKKTLIGFEALIRWILPSGEFISPNDFIPVAEETGLILPISSWVLKTTIEQLGKWQKSGYDKIRLSINLSSRQIQHEDFMIEIEEAIKASAVNTKNISLELTEHSLLEELDLISTRLCKLKSLGFKLSIDDFGTGYSSLSYIHKLPIDTLKIDRSFIIDYPEKIDMTIVDLIYGMSRHFKMDIVVEGIENSDQEDYVTKLGCEYGQGYLYSKPLKLEDATKLINHDQMIFKGK